MVVVVVVFLPRKDRHLVGNLLMRDQTRPDAGQGRYR